MTINRHVLDRRPDQFGGHFFERYLLVVVILGVTQALFVVPLYDFLQNSPQLLGRFKLFPTDLLLLPLTILIVLLSLLNRRRKQRIWSDRTILFVLWMIFSIYGLALGIINHTYYLTSDVKNLLIRPLFAPLFYVLGMYVDLDKVLSISTKVSTLLALFVGINAFDYFIGKPSLVDVSSSIMPGLALLLPFAILFNKFLTSKISLLEMIALFICAFGVIGDFWKPKVAALVICVFVALSLFFIGKYKFSFKSKKFFSSLAWIALLTFIFLLVVYIGGYWEKLINLVGVSYLKNNAAISDLSGNRFEIIRIGIERWRQNPYFGYGFGEPLSGYYLDYFVGVYLYRDRLFPHNTSLQVLFQTGLIGFTIVSLIILFWIRKVFRSLKAESLSKNFYYKGLLTFCFTIMFVSFYSEVIVSDVLGFLFWMCIGFEAAYAQKALSAVNNNSQIPREIKRDWHNQ